VRPGVVGMQYSQDRMAKKNAPMIMSTVWSYALARILELPSLCSALRKRGVMAFCLFGGGSRLSNARKSDLKEGSSWVLPW
jgi:hypothetical protein